MLNAQCRTSNSELRDVVAPDFSRSRIIFFLGEELSAGSFGCATMGVLALLLGDETPFTLSSPGLPGVTATYQSFSDAAAEVGLSRIWGGIHFRTACEVGRGVGEYIADQAVANYLRPR
jgi:hypothetical protein